MSCRTRPVCMSLIAVLCLVPGSPAWSQAAQVEGAFRRSAGDAATIDEAIEAAVGKMNFIARPIARSRLKKTNPPYERIEISGQGGQISVRFDERKPILMPADGQPVKWSRDDGEEFDVSARVEGMQLTQTFKAGDGERVNRFGLQADGSTLILDVTITSPRLSSPVRYSLTYMRE